MIQHGKENPHVVRDHECTYTWELPFASFTYRLSLPRIRLSGWRIGTKTQLQSVAVFIFPGSGEFHMVFILLEVDLITVEIISNWIFKGQRNLSCSWFVYLRDNTICRELSCRKLGQLMAAIERRMLTYWWAVWIPSSETNLCHWVSMSHVQDAFKTQGSTVGIFAYELSISISSIILAFHVS